MYKLTLISLMLSAYLISQEVIIKSKETGFTLDGVVLLNEENQFSGITDINGKVQWEPDALSHEFFILEHPNIEKDTLYAKDIEKTNEFLVTELGNLQLEELVIANEPKDFFIIEGYFTYYATNNGKFNLFVDGKMRFIVKNKTFKIKKSEILQYRNFKLTDANDNFNKKEIKSFVFDNDINLPNLKILEKYDKFKDKIKVSQVEGTDAMEVNFLDSSDDFHIRLLGYDFRNFVQNGKYSLNGNDPENLKSLKKLYNEFSVQIKHKEEKNYSEIKEFTTFYATRVYFRDKSDLEDSAIKYKKEKSNYFEDFWTDQPYASTYFALAKGFGENVKESDNIQN